MRWNEGKVSDFWEAMGLANTAFKLQTYISLQEKGGMTPKVVQSSVGLPTLPWTQRTKGLGEKVVSSLVSKDEATALIPVEQTANTQGWRDQANTQVV